MPPSTSKQQLPAKLVDRLNGEGLIYANADGQLICLHRDFEQWVTGATAIDLKSEQPQDKLINGSSRTGGHFIFFDRAEVDARRVVITTDPIESMAYSVIHDPDCPTIYLATHDGRWIPGDKFGNLEVTIATDRELLNLPPHAQRHLPKSKSWATDLKTLTQSILTTNLEQAEKQRQEEQKAPRSTPRSMPLEHKRNELSN